MNQIVMKTQARVYGTKIKVLVIMLLVKISQLKAYVYIHLTDVIGHQDNVIILLIVLQFKEILNKNV